MSTQVTEKNGNGSDQQTESRGPAAIFNIKMSIEINNVMAENLVDLFTEATSKGIRVDGSTWAFFKQLENWIGEKS